MVPCAEGYEVIEVGEPNGVPWVDVMDLAPVEPHVAVVDRAVTVHRA